MTDGPNLDYLLPLKKLFFYGCAGSSLLLWLSLAEVRGLLGVVASLVADPRL